MSIKDAKVDVVLQRVEEDIGEELDVIPSHVRRFGVNNIFTRTLSYLFGWKADGKPIKIAATATGAMKIASVGAGLEYVSRKEGIATDTKSAFITFTEIQSRLDIFVKDYDMWLYTSIEGTIEEEALRCLPNIRNVFDIATKAFKVQRAGINDVEYEVVGER